MEALGLHEGYARVIWGSCPPEPSSEHRDLCAGLRVPHTLNDL